MHDDATTQPMAISIDSVTSSMASRVRMYRWRRPEYQTALLGALRSVWDPSHMSVLDVGGGTGLIAQTLKELFRMQRLVSIDVTDRYLTSLDIETSTFDGRHIPFGDGEFDCVVMINVLHHVPLEARAILLRECARVSRTGVVYIKDHLAQSWLDHLRLWALDVIGNVPFGGMTSARYLDARDWSELAAACGFEIVQVRTKTYRRGLMSAVFPNRLESTMKWRMLRS